MSSRNIAYERYSRQIILKEFGEAGQQKLSQAKVLMIGAGGLGCAALPYLVAAGVGTIGIIDDDTVSLSNLHRQVLYRVADIGLPKAETAAAALRQLNPDIDIHAYNEKLTVVNAIEIMKPYDIIVDGTDTFASRYMINDACVLLNKPLVYGAVSRFEGQVSVFNVLSGDNATLGDTSAGGSPFLRAAHPVSVNYRDLFPQPPAAGEIANCAETGVLGVLPGIIGTMQANEAIKLITGIGEPLVNKLLTYNALNNQVYELQLAARENTRGLIPKDETSFRAMDYDWLCGITGNDLEIDLKQFDELRYAKNTLLIDVREKDELPAVTEFDHIHIPVGAIAEQMPETESDTIIVFCQSGVRSLQAARLLTEKFGDSKKIFSLAGGIQRWKETL